MKVFHIESGLGNQMLDYADLMASRLVNPDEDYYIETILYEISDYQKSISMWNGYELGRIFGIDEKNIRDCFDERQWDEILKYVVSTEFWNDGWTYSDAITEAFNRQGLVLNNIYKRPHTGKNIAGNRNSVLKYLLKWIYFSVFRSKEYSLSVPEKLFYKSDSNDYNGHYLRFMHKGNQIERIEEKLRAAFVFPEYDEKNAMYADTLKSSNSVAIHARRGDFLGYNASCYKLGYFKRAVSLIKKKVADPLFVIFSDPESVEWCKENPQVFGLDFSKDRVQFVDWNSGLNSYRDMQLMTECKHNIITNSSFGWWGAYLNPNSDKITISPDARMNTTHWV